MRSSTQRWLPWLAILLTALACSPLPWVDAVTTPGPYREYYVAQVVGSDETGDGSESNPWETINYALDHVDYDSSPKPRINLAKGVYEEYLQIESPVVLRGAGHSPAAIDPTTGLPIRETSWLERAVSGNIEPGIVVEDAASVRFEHLGILRGHVRVVNTNFVMDDVEIKWAQGYYALKLEDVSNFILRDSQFRSTGGVAGDLGVWVQESTGVMHNIYAGAGFDHGISVFGDSNVTIEGSRIEGSPIAWADGIQAMDSIASFGATETDTTHIDEGMRLRVLDTEIIRSPEGAEPALEDGSNARAAIRVQSSALRDEPVSRILIDNVTMSGFDAGFSANAGNFHVRVQNTDLSGVSYGVDTWHNGAMTVPAPLLDFGGGPLGSPGGNTFGDSGEYDFHHQSYYSAFACDNDWGVPRSEVPDQIHDHVDDPDLGAVFWYTCEREALSLDATLPPTRVDGSDGIYINFNADRYTIERDQCTTLRWQVSGASSIMLLGQEREATDAQQVCPDQTTGYTLTAENETSDETAFLQIEVTEPKTNAPQQGCLVYDQQTQQNVCQVPCQQQNPEQYETCTE